MGSEDLFHKRKAKVAGGLGRKKAKKKPYDKVLIVCEGSKTEPNYFSKLIGHYKINNANVVINGSCKSSPGVCSNMRNDFVKLRKKKVILSIECIVFLIRTSMLHTIKP